MLKQVFVFLKIFACVVHHFDVFGEGGFCSSYIAISSKVPSVAVPLRDQHVLRNDLICG